MLSKEHLESLTRVWVETHLVNKMATELQRSGRRAIRQSVQQRFTLQISKAGNDD